MNPNCTLLVPSFQQTKPLLSVLLQFNLWTRILWTHGQVEAKINFTVIRPEETAIGNLVFNNAPLATNIIQEPQQVQHTPPSPAVTFGMQAQLNAPKRAPQLSQATMQFVGLQLDDQIIRRSGTPGQLNLVSYRRSPQLNKPANDPLIFSQPQALINATAVPTPVHDPIAL